MGNQKQKIANVYIDGFNFYYNAVKNTSYKWLDFSKMINLLFPSFDINMIKYFTSRVKSLSRDPDQQIRQQIFLRALGTLPNLEIIYGHFTSYPTFLPLLNPPPQSNGLVEVLKTQEKGSDVNLATHLLRDGFMNLYDIAIVISNDSDLAEAIKIVNLELLKEVIIACPNKNSVNNMLKKYASQVIQIRDGVLAASQFPTTMQDEHGQFSKPPTW
jgi:uncharacterized LabA/DUF88 family protein